MKLASLTFLSLLWVAHAGDDDGRLVGTPLSLFREEKRLLGYGLFWSLLLVGVFETLILVRSSRREEAYVAGFATLLLIGVAATDSYGGFHNLCALLLLLTLFGYFGFLLYRANSFWLFGHLFVPVVLGLATRLHSYGIWQKGFIVYFVLACTVHHHLLKRQLPRRRERKNERAKRRYNVRLMSRSGRS